jgi:hypothetical protein
LVSCGTVSHPHKSDNSMRSIEGEKSSKFYVLL